MNPKRSMSLPINMIIIVAIGFTLLILAIFWIKNFFGGLTQQTEDINKITQQAIDSLVVKDPNAKFFLSKDMVTVGRGKVKAIAYYIQNFDNQANDFYMAINCVNSNADADFKNNCHPEDWFLKYLIKAHLDPKGNYKDALVVTAPKGTTPGSYVFDIYVCKGQGSGNLQKNCNGEIYDQKTLIIEVR